MRFNRTSAGFLGCMLIATAVSVTHADGDGDLRGKLVTAWQKYSQFLDMSLAYTGKAAISLEIDQTAAYREDVLANIRLMQIEVDSYPRRRNNLQEAVYQQLLGLRQELTATDRRLAELRSYLKQMDEMALRQAELNGQPAKPTNRRDLLRESQRLEQIAAFTSLKEIADATANEAGVSREQALSNAMDSMALSRRTGPARAAGDVHRGVQTIRSQ